MDDKIKTLSEYRMGKAKEELQTAALNLEHDKISQSVNRSYYAFFHASRALLAYDLFDAKRHSAIIAFFNQKYIATGQIDKSFYKGCEGHAEQAHHYALNQGFPRKRHSQ